MNSKSETSVIEAEKLTFEESLRGLEQVVESLESSNTPLAELVELYERGTLLKARCEVLLRDAEMKIEKIRLGAGGEVEGTAPFDPTS